jgi:hypothetical protein
MSKFFCLGYRSKELQALNIVRRFCNLLHVSDIAKCDGHTLNKFVISDCAEELVSHVFPREEPTLADVQAWNKGITRLCSSSISLIYIVGQYVHRPHLPHLWFTMEIPRTLCRVREDMCGPSYNTYHLQEQQVGI